MKVIKNNVYTQAGSSTWEVNTTNLEKNLDSLPPATNISVTVRAFNDVGSSTANTPVFCVTDDDGKANKRTFCDLDNSYILIMICSNAVYHTVISDIIFIKCDDGGGGSTRPTSPVAGDSDGSKESVGVMVPTLPLYWQDPPLHTLFCQGYSGKQFNTHTHAHTVLQ